VKPTIATSSLFADHHNELKRVGSKNVQYPCDADVGTPTPKVTWQKIGLDGEVLKNLSTGIGQVNLEFDEISKGDRSGYRCVAENEGGAVNKDFYLNVECKLYCVVIF
jgi:Immunoglobulin I-set domain.